jgi:hypothetical protein
MLYRWLTHRRFRRTAGWCVSVACLGAGAWGLWFEVTKLGPFRSDLQANDYRARRELRAWQATRKRFHKGFQSHEDFEWVGSRGSTEEVRVAIRLLPAEGKIEGCLGSVRPHWAEMLRRLTGQDAGPNAEDWHRWWDANKDKTQADWIRDAFLPLGIDPERKPSADEVQSLLRLIGLHHHLRRSRSFSHGVHISEGIAFNAMRILRDYDVDPTTVSLEDGSRPETRFIVRGLTHYARFQAQHGLNPGVGVVFDIFASQSVEDDFPEPFPIEMQRWFPWAWLGGSGAIMLVGGWLSWKLWRTRRPASDGFPLSSSAMVVSE